MMCREQDSIHGPCACEMKGFLRFLVLHIIKKNPGITGKGIRLELKKKRGSEPSPGTIYPVLKLMNEESWIIEVKDDNDREKKYKLTEEGEKVLNASIKKFIRIFGDLKEEFLKH